MQGTTEKEDIDRIKNAFADIFHKGMFKKGQHPFSQSPHDDDRNRFMWLWHSLSNLATENTRRHPQGTWKLFSLAIIVIIVLYETSGLV